MEFASVYKAAFLNSIWYIARTFINATMYPDPAQQYKRGKSWHCRKKVKLTKRKKMQNCLV
jgi:hypothetical protein